ncbi:MAG: GNAT family N-acetyltransferase [Aureispira sp.]
MHSVELVTNHCRLRLPHPNDSHSIQRYYVNNKAFFKAWLPTYATRRFELDFITEHTTQLLQQYLKGHTLPLLVLGRRSNRLLGRINYTKIERGNLQSCFVGYQMNAEDTSKGLITEALCEGNRYVFDYLHLHRINAYIMPPNQASIRVVEKLGFQQEGLSKAVLKIDGAWRDHWRYALINPAD